MIKTTNDMWHVINEKQLKGSCFSEYLSQQFAVGERVNNQVVRGKRCTEHLWELDQDWQRETQPHIPVLTIALTFQSRGGPFRHEQNLKTKQSQLTGRIISNQSEPDAQVRQRLQNVKYPFFVFKQIRAACVCRTAPHMVRRYCNRKTRQRNTWNLLLDW